jgi:hypothetical protein
MTTTFTTSQECYQVITSTNETASTSTRASTGAIDLARDIVYPLIRRWHGASDSNGVCKSLELQLVTAYISARLVNQNIFLQLTEDMVNMLRDDEGSAGVTSHEPNQDGAITG